ncbi:MAG TPA: hypothetical protein VMZ91_10190 [Candidatus Paceibacterota bacterium]|nr:hypothetical protein [Candidatus Paceibacterota bacterium]
MNDKKEKEFEKSKKKVLALCDKYKVDYQLIDIEALWDNSITEAENMPLFESLIEGLSGSEDIEKKIEGDKKTKKISVKNEKNEAERIALENLKKETEISKKEFEETLNKIKFETTDILEQAFAQTKALLQTLIKSKEIFGLILKGESGIGKSYTTLKVLKDLDMKKGEDYDMLSAYTTPLEFYQFLYENKDNKIVILDDTMAFFNNPINIGIVLSSLWGEGKRIVHYNSSSGKLKVPTSFIFNSKIVWCVNTLPKQLGAVKSRCFYHELEFSYQHKIKLLYEIAKIKKIDLKLVDFIKDNSDELTEDLDFRLLMKVNDISKHNKEWEAVARKLLGKTTNLTLLKQYLKESTTIGEAQKLWCEQTGRCRKSFYNLKQRIENKSVKV